MTRLCFADVRLRLPEAVFSDYLRLDLGGKVVELYHFGRGNTPGDTVVYVPGARVAWTGNLILGDGTIPFLVEGQAQAYMETLARFARTLDVETIVPGHGGLTSGAIFGRYLQYLNELTESVRGSLRAGRTLEEALAGNSLAPHYLPPAQSPFAQLTPFLVGLHRWNFQRTYQEMSGR
jgi:cyclase